MLYFWGHITQVSITGLTLKQLETHGCMLSIVATDVLALKQQTISIYTADIYSADKKFIVLGQCHTTILHL